MESSFTRGSNIPQVPPLGDSATNGTHNINRRISFTRSRSPAVVRSSVTAKPVPRASSTQAPFGSTRHRPFPVFRSILPTAIQFYSRIPASRALWTFYIDTRKAGECLLLSASLLFVIIKLFESSPGESALHVQHLIGPIQLSSATLPRVPPLILELSFLLITSLLYIVGTHISYVPAPSTDPADHTNSPASPHSPGRRESRRIDSPNVRTSKDNHGFIWMSVPKNYRCGDLLSSCDILFNLYHQRIL
jgi:hypothetical protein